jgi:integrase
MANFTFSDGANAVIAAYSGRDKAFTSRVQFWINQFGHKDIAEATRDDIEDAIDVLVKKKKQRNLTRGVNGRQVSVMVELDEVISGSTVNRHIAAFGTVFKTLRRMRKLPRGFSNPCTKIERMEEGEGRTLSVTVDDVKRLVAACRISRTRKLAAIVAMGCTTGWRLGTLQGLRWSQINLKEGFADTGRTKNGTPHRTPLLPWVVQELVRMCPDTAQDGDLVFGKGTFHKAWKMSLQLADLPGEWAFHHTRHIAASILAQSGASVVTMMSALYHRTPLMAMRYSHLNIDSVRDSMRSAWS